MSYSVWCNTCRLWYVNCYCEHKAKEYARSLIDQLGYKRVKHLINNPPPFVRDEIDQDEVLYCLRTEQFIVRSQHGAKIQLDKLSDEYSYSTMPYSSSFYDECVLLKDIRAELLSYCKENRIFEVGDKIYPIVSDHYTSEVCELVEDMATSFRYKTALGNWGFIEKALMSKTWRHATDKEISDIPHGRVRLED
ncbi:hypothetical protein [Acinetobacter brisouii]|uniref:hypothetical protein n=1 Tax=Acinetobacter brisouii TaxID=396323 RepID=UPI00124EEAA3|nr:hypothetical protein [Acinetobacter brisouii]